MYALPPELFQQITQAADRSLLKKLLVIRPFHHFVLKIIYANCRHHILLSEKSTEIIDSNKIPLSSMHQLYAARIHVYVHAFELAVGKFENEVLEREREAESPDCYRSMAPRRLPVYVHHVSHEEVEFYITSLSSQRQTSLNLSLISNYISTFALGFAVGVQFVTLSIQWWFRNGQMWKGEWHDYGSIVALLVSVLCKIREAHIMPTHLIGHTCVGAIAFLLPCIITWAIRIAE